MKIVTIILFIFVLLNGCIDNAPRDNPRDPVSPGYSKSGGLQGKIIIPGQSTGIEGVVVTENIEKISVTTDSAGKFLFEQISLGVHYFICTKQNFINDTFQVTIQSGETAQITRGLNAVPEGSISGRIFILNKTTGIEGAIITEIDSKIFVTTDLTGNFLFEKLSFGVHRFVCTKQNFVNDTFQVTIQSGTPVQIIRALNGIPFVISRKILTRKIDQYFPGTTYSVDIEADVSDPNGNNDLVSVLFNVDSLKFSLSYDVSGKKIFIATLEQGVFPTNTIQYLVGKPLYIISRDTNNAVNKSDPFYVTRVIENAAVPLSPINNVILKTDSISFHWSQPDVTFNYTYTIFVSQVISGELPKLVRTYSGVNSINQQYPVDGSVITLAEGNYIWTVAIVDDFGNYSRSKEYPFVVIK